MSAGFQDKGPTILAAPQRSAEWFEARRGLPTCSRFDQILQPVKGGPSTSQEALIDELLAESMLPDDQTPSRMSADMEFGMKLEAEARCSYELGYAQGAVKEVGFVLASCGMFGGSPDALVGEDGGAEIKCPNAVTHIRYSRLGVLPNDYKCQVHGYMIVTARDHWDFFSYHRGLTPFCLRVHRDEFTAKLAAELAQFVVRYNAARAKFGLKPIGTP